MFSNIEGETASLGTKAVVYCIDDGRLSGSRGADDDVDCVRLKTNDPASVLDTVEGDFQNVPTGHCATPNAEKINPVVPAPAIHVPSRSARWMTCLGSGGSRSTCAFAGTLLSSPITPSLHSSSAREASPSLTDTETIWNEVSTRAPRSRRISGCLFSQVRRPDLAPCQEEKSIQALVITIKDRKAFLF